MKKLLKNENGLTLVELLAVIVILAIVGTIAFVSIGSVIDNSRKDAVISNALQVVSAAKLVQATTEEDFDTAVDIEELPLDTMYDPWNPKVELSGTVQWVGGVEDGEFHVIINSEKCNIHNESESSLHQKDRDEICKNTSYTPPNP